MSILKKKNSKFVLEMTMNIGKVLVRYFKDFESAQDCGEKYFNAIGWKYTIKEIKG